MQDPRAMECLRRHSRLKGLRAPLEPLWAEAAKRCLPLYADITGQEDPASRARMTENFDSTAMAALGKFASAIESVTTPRNVKWHNLVPSDPDLADDIEVRRYCEAVRDRLFAMRNDARSNFAGSSHDAYRMLGVFGHGPMFVHHVVGSGIRYMAVPARELWIDQDATGVVDTVHREYTLSPRQALAEFGEDLPHTIRAMAEREGSSSGQDVRFLHCVYPDPDFDPSKANALSKPFLSVHLLQGGGEVVRVSGFRTMPYLIPRYETMPGSPYGFGPALTILPEIKMVNEMGKTMIRAAHLATSPPLLLRNDDLLAPFSVVPDSLNYGGLDDQGRPAVRPLETGQRFDVGKDLLNARQVTINDAFLVTLFQILVQQPNMTATEVLQRANEKGTLLAPTMGRIQAEMLGPMIRRELDIASGVPGLLPDPPEALRNAQAVFLEVDYASPLAKAQQSGDSLNAIRMLEAIAPLAQLDPGVLDNVNMDEVVKEVARGFDVAARVLRSPEEIEAIRGQKAQAAQAQQMLAAAPVVASSAKDMAQAQAAGAQAQAAGGGGLPPEIMQAMAAAGAGGAGGGGQ